MPYRRVPQTRGHDNDIAPLIEVGMVYEKANVAFISCLFCGQELLECPMYKVDSIGCRLPQNATAAKEVVEYLISVVLHLWHGSQFVSQSSCRLCPGQFGATVNRHPPS